MKKMILVLSVFGMLLAGCAHGGNCGCCKKQCAECSKSADDKSGSGCKDCKDKEEKASAEKK